MGVMLQTFFWDCPRDGEAFFHSYATLKVTIS